ILFLIIASPLLWLFSGWSARHGRPAVLIYAGVALLEACLALVVYGLFFSASLAARARMPVETVLGYMVVPLFLCLPPAIVFCCSQFLLRWQVGIRKVKVVATLAAVGACVILPFAVVVAGCGLAGACF
ncbi:MAG: hypothetical protein V4772_03250, partial [Pseudomonadota bacterium]